MSSATTTLPAASSGGTGWDWFDGLDADTRKALLLAGFNAGSSYFQGRQEDAQEDERRRDAAITNKQEGIRSLLNSETSDYRYNQDREASNAVQASKMAGNSPLQFQSQRAQMSALGDILGGAGRADLSGTPSHISKHMPNRGKPITTTPFSANTQSFFDPGNMARAEGDFFNVRSNIDPTLESPDLGGVGYGDGGTGVTNQLETQRNARLAERDTQDQAYNTQANARRAALEASLSEMGPDAQENANGGPDDDDGGIDWKKWAGIGAGAAGGYFLGGRG
jgi:hypothetical protein